MKEIYFVPIRLQSEGNKIEHWRVKYSRRKKIKEAIRFHIFRTQVKPPCHVILTRIAPRSLDEEDNLRMSLKCPKDCVADILIPGLQPGRADESKEITWDFKQEKGKPKEYGLKIELEGKKC
jgi:hypothetical protein